MLVERRQVERRVAAQDAAQLQLARARPLGLSTMTRSVVGDHVNGFSDRRNTRLIGGRYPCPLGMRFELVIASPASRTTARPRRPTARPATSTGMALTLHSRGEPMVELVASDERSQGRSSRRTLAHARRASRHGTPRASCPPGDRMKAKNLIMFGTPDVQSRTLLRFPTPRRLSPHRRNRSVD